MNSNQMNEEHLPKPQKTKEKNNRFTALKVILIITLIAIAIVASLGFASGAEWIKAILCTVLILVFAVFLGYFIRVKRKRTQK